MATISTNMAAPYVKAFAKDALKDPSCSQEAATKVQKMLFLCERGLLTSVDAVRGIVKTVWE